MARGVDELLGWIVGEMAFYPQGCALRDLVRLIAQYQSAHDDETLDESNDASREQPEAAEAFARSIWRWLTARQGIDYLVDDETKQLDYHALSLLPDEPRHRADAGDKTKAAAPPYLPRLYVSEETIWKTLTGHGVDLKRVPRTEFICLGGIASRREQGIVQGDLGRLVDQDKRSVPKRTDFLVAKGYIIKRTVLVKGSKTSRMWLTRFAPPLPDATHQKAVTDDVDAAALTADLESVPWCHHWTGKDVDFSTLGKSIHAILKAWQVMRIDDLKRKLGINKSRWHMKIVARLLRRLTSTGTLQYTAARFDHDRVVFKDCIKYLREPTDKEWRLFLSTGKNPLRGPRTGQAGPRGDGSRSYKPAEQAQSPQTQTATSEAWQPELPLSHELLDVIWASGPEGITALEAAQATVGKDFGAHVSTQLKLMSAPEIQPQHLIRYQLSARKMGNDKTAPKRYVAPSTADAVENSMLVFRSVDAAEFVSGHQAVEQHNDRAALETTAATVHIDELDDEADDSNAVATPKKRKGSVETASLNTEAPRKRQRVAKPSTNGVVSAPQEMQQDLTLSSPGEVPKPIQSPSETSPMHRSPAVEAAANSADGRDLDSTKADTHDQAKDAATEAGDASEPKRTMGRKPKATRIPRGSKPSEYKCEKCGKIWKNDNGLEYHLEKSRTLCNPYFAEHPEELEPKPVVKKPRPKRKSAVGEMNASPPRAAKTRTSVDFRLDDSVDEADEPIGYMSKRDSRLPAFEGNLSQNISSKPIDSGFALPAGWDTASKLASDDQRPLEWVVESFASAEQPDPGPVELEQYAENSIIDGPPADLTPRPRSMEKTSRDVLQVQIAVPHSNLLTWPLPAFTFSQEGDSGLKPMPLLNRRVAEIIKWLLVCGKSVFPGDKAMWHAVVQIYVKAFGSKEKLPSKTTCLTALRALSAVGEAKEDVIAFRDSRGTFVHCYLLTQPGLSMLDPQVLAMKAEIQAAWPESWVPLGFAPEGPALAWVQTVENTEEIVATGMGARDGKLSDTVASLNAPFYKAHGIRAFRKKPVAQEYRPDSTELVFDRELGTFRQRKKKGPKGPRNEAATKSYAQWVAQEDAIDPEVTAWLSKHMPNPGVESLPSSFFFPGSTEDDGPVDDVVFLQPNTGVGDEESLADEEQQAAKDYTGYEVDAALIDPALQEKLLGYTFASTKVLTESNTKAGLWEQYDEPWYMDNDCSFAIQGAMPVFDAVKLPQSMADIRVRVEGRSVLSVDTSEQFHIDLDTVEKWETSIQGKELFHAASIVFNYAFINHAPFVPSQGLEPSSYTWPSQHQFNIRSMPYTNLDDNPDAISRSARERRTRRSQTQPEAQPDEVSEFDPDSEPESQVMDGRHDQPAASSKGRGARTSYYELQRINAQEGYECVELKGIRKFDDTPPGDAVSILSADPQYAIDWNSDDAHVAAFVAVTSLTGGVDRAVDWGLVWRIIPDVSISMLRKYWLEVRKQRDTFINSLYQRFQDEFLVAYENGELPTYDYEKPSEYDWARLICWTLRLAVSEDGASVPKDRQTLDREFSLQLTAEDEYDWRDLFHHWQRSTFMRYQDATTEVACVTIGPAPGLDEVQDEMHIRAESWMRALCCTPEGAYSPQVIKKRFLQYGAKYGLDEDNVNDIVDRAVKSLEAKRIVHKAKGKVLQYGRPFRINEHTQKQFERLSNFDKYLQAASFKAELDEAFKAGEALELPYHFDDGSMIALINLQAHRQMDTEAVKEPHIPFGFKMGYYETRKLDKSHFAFEVRIHANDRWLHNDDIEMLKNISAALPNLPGETPNGMLPFWCDFFGKINAETFGKMLGAVLFVLATKGAMSAEMVTRSLKPCAELYEVEIVMDWAKEHGLLKQMMPGGGWSVTEWWWLVVGQFAASG